MLPLHVMNTPPATRPRPYPPELEKWWLERIFRFYRTRDPRTAFKRQAPAVARLSDLFTKDRAAGFADYSSEDEFLLAYGTFTFPQTFTRLGLVLEELASIGRLPFLEEPELRITDLGCGAGGATAGLLHFLRLRSTAQKLIVQGIDHSTKALDLFSRLLLEQPELWPGHLKWQTKHLPLTPEVTLPPGPLQHVLLLSFALGEIFYDQPASRAADWLELCRKSIEPGGLVIIVEPALKETTLRLMALRDQLVAAGWKVLAPCPHAFACPMLKEGKHWCHEVRTWNVPPDLQRVNEHLKRSVHELKFSFLALQPPTAPALDSAPYARMVAPLAKVKGRYITRVCSPNGHLEEWEIQTRTVEVAGRRHLDQFARGQWVEAPQKAPLTLPGSYRLASPDHLIPRPLPTIPEPPR